MLSENGVTITKCFLHISKDAQRRRLQDRLDERDKVWKFDPADVEARRHWEAYQEAYAGLLAACSTRHAPWYVVPANHKWFRDYAVRKLLIETLRDLPLRPPKPRFDPATIVIP
jgi:polyphosphate kinase 2 (PPK2 family)